MTKKSSPNFAGGTGVSFDAITAALAKPMLNVFQRWMDEHEYEAEAFKKFFEPLASTIGGEVERVAGTRTRLDVFVKFPAPDLRSVVRVSLTASGLFTSKVVRRF